MSLATDFRPKKFEDVVGQRAEIEIMSAILVQGWRPPALLFRGAFGCGKTSLARLLARALLCEDLQQGAVSPEPCGACSSCAAMDARNHPDFREVDAASHGGVKEVRAVVEEASYRSASKVRAICFDECHMMTNAGQNALLQVLEEGIDGVIFLFCTTDAEKMLPTIRSRCIDVPVRLLRGKEIQARLQTVANAAKIAADEEALRLIAAYSRGHMRDALICMEQLHRSAGGVTADIVRTHLRLDRRAEVFTALCEQETARMEALEDLLCRYPFRELADEIGGALLDAHKLAVGLDDVSDADRDAISRVLGTIGKARVLPIAERIFRLPSEPTSIQAALASLEVAITLDDAPRGAVKSGKRSPPGDGDGSFVPDLTKA